MINFKLLGRLDPCAFATAVAIYGKHFADATWRQTAPQSPHADTETIFLRMPPQVTPQAIFHSMEIDDLLLYRQCSAFRRPCLQIADAMGLPLARAMIVKLKAGGAVAEHRDEGVYADATERFHFAVETAPDVIFHCGGEQIVMEAGAIYWFNKHLTHSVVNHSDRDRLHLIVDLLAR